MPPDGPDPLRLALDQGGHASRALVFDPHGCVIARSLRELREFHPQPGWVEQDPEELVASLFEVIREVEGELGDRAKAIASAGLATQRSSIVCWDRITGEALSPVLSWQDRRAYEWLARFAPQAEDIHRATGLRLSPHYGASKLRWCLDHLPRVSAAAGDGRLAMGPLASFLVFRLTEERAFLADPANASRTLLWNLRAQDWDAGLLHLFDIPRAALPDCVPSRFDYGRLVGNRHPLLAMVTGDQSAALFARGQPAPGQVSLNIGTGAFVQRVAGDSPDAPGRLLAGIVLSDGEKSVYTIEGTVNGAGSALAWAEAEFDSGPVADQLEGWLRREGEPPLFLNGIGGLGAPFWVADFPSRMIGDGEPWRKIVAVAESIVFLVQANLDEFRKANDSIEQIVVSGGLAEIDSLCQRLSDLSGLPLHRPAEHEATARGLAWLLAGRPSSWTGTESGQWFRPGTNPALRARYARWRTRMQGAAGY